MSTKPPRPKKQAIAAKARVAIVASRFNESIVEKLLSGCLERFAELGLPRARLDVHHVPGAFELPLTAKLLARTGKYSAIICLGCVIRGETPHFDYVAGHAASGIGRVALEECLPVIFGVLTTNNERQALERTGGKHGHAGRRAADAAAEMMALADSI
jgi:6,7-dimethyl-8-ribityllumazine synthase